jgi:hypothetical protein
VHSDWGGALFLTARGLDRRLARAPRHDGGARRPPSRRHPASRPPATDRLAAPPAAALRTDGTPAGPGRAHPGAGPNRRSATRPSAATCSPTAGEHPISRRSSATPRHCGTSTATHWRCGRPATGSCPPAHGRRLAALMPQARYAQIPGAYVLSMPGQPEAVAREIGQFLTSAPAATELSQDHIGP